MGEEDSRGNVDVSVCTFKEVVVADVGDVAGINFKEGGRCAVARGTFGMAVNKVCSLHPLRIKQPHPHSSPHCTIFRQ